MQSPKRLAFALASFALASLVVACSKQADTPDPSTTYSSGNLGRVTVADAVLPREITLDGTLEAVAEATVSAQTTGRVKEIRFDVGDYVPRGEIILTLTDTEQKSAVKAAQGSLEEAKARLGEAKLTYDRSKDLMDRKLIARADLDKAQAELNSAEARVSSAEAALASAKESLDYTVIRAPYAGTVVKRHVQPGETVAPGQPLMTGLSLERLRAIVDLPQKQIAAVRQYHHARVLLPGRDGVDAENLRIPPQADRNTHTFRILVELPEGDYGVFPGFLVKVAFVIGEESRLIVPDIALVRRGEVTGAYVIGRDGKVTFRYVRVGAGTGDGKVPVLAGLAAGEEVAIDPIAAGIVYKDQGEAK
ncbi:MAG: efflux RND transporter periplasmic adaptor subunit [Pseudomonadales bacterium]|nr:efflux RND transporter periplasmic adaptor subunit [Pseudomonadales bacterium]